MLASCVARLQCCEPKPCSRVAAAPLHAGSRLLASYDGRSKHLRLLRECRREPKRHGTQQQTLLHISLAGDARS